ncbi:MAG: response regulator [Fibrobacteria bacterium]|nr:response regulator [Fibrobacteria bacterium]
MESKKQKILIIDDDIDIIVLLKRYLEKAGYEVVSAANGIDGITKAGSECPDLILLDIELPEMSGHQVGIFLQKEFPDIPVMVLSSKTTPQDVYKAEISGVVDYLAKSVDLNIVVSKVDSFFKSNCE